MADERSERQPRVPDWVWKTLALLVVPILGWGIKLEVNGGVQDERIATAKENMDTLKADHKVRLNALEGTVKVQAERIVRLQGDLAEAKEMRKAITANTLEVAKMGTKIDAILKNLNEVKSLLREP